MVKAILLILLATLLIGIVAMYEQLKKNYEKANKLFMLFDVFLAATILFLVVWIIK